MGSYAYCQHKNCERGLDKPTPRQIIEDDWVCRDGHHNQLHNGDDKDSIILDLWEQLEELKTKHNELQSEFDDLKYRSSIT